MSDDDLTPHKKKRINSKFCKRKKGVEHVLEFRFDKKFSFYHREHPWIEEYCTVCNKSVRHIYPHRSYFGPMTPDSMNPEYVEIARKLKK